MDLEILNPLDCSGWDDFLLTHDNSSFFHTSHWAKILSETYGYEPLYFTKNDNGKLVVLIPVMHIESFLTGKRGVSLPFTDFCEPIVTPVSDREAVWESLTRYGANAGWKYLEIRGGEGFGQKKEQSTWYYEHILDLSEDLPAVYKRFRDSNKRNIKKAQKAGVEVDFSNSQESLREFYRLNCLTRKMHGLPPQPFAFFKNIYRHAILNNSGLLATARYRGEAIASSIYLHFGRKVIYKFGASDRKFQHLRANNLVMWKAIEWYCRNNYASLNLGRTDPGHDGLRSFKNAWGAQEQRKKYYRYDFSKNDFVRSSPKVNGWHTGVFRNMPVPALQMIGRILYRHMA